MIKFFRQIRNNLIIKGKTGKPASPAHPNGSSGRAGRYLKYAVGEILLVVLGILIALQINNWNEGRKEKLRFIAELKELKSELLSFDDLIDIRITSLKSADAYGQYLQDFANNKLDKIDTIRLRKAIYYTGYLLVFEKTNAAFQKLVNEGDIQLIENIELKKALANFYNVNSWRSSYHNNVILKSYEEYLSYIHKFTSAGTLRSFYQAEMLNLFNDITLSGTSIEGIDVPNGELVYWEKLKSDPEFKALIDKVQTNRYLQITQYGTENKNDIRRLVAMIDNELDNQ